MDFMIWILIGFMSLLILLLLFFGILFVFKRRTVLTIIMPDKKLSSKMFFGDVSKTEKVNDGEYFIDDTCMIEGFFGKKLYYFYGNPNPINFDFEKNQPTMIGTKAQDLKTFHESDLIKKLYTTESLENTIMWLVIGIGIISIVILIIILTKKTPPVMLSNTENNTQLIVNAVKIAIKGMG